MVLIRDIHHNSKQGRGTILHSHASLMETQPFCHVYSRTWRRATISLFASITVNQSGGKAYLWSPPCSPSFPYSSAVASSSARFRHRERLVVRRYRRIAKKRSAAPRSLTPMIQCLASAAITGPGPISTAFSGLKMTTPPRSVLHLEQSRNHTPIDNSPYLSNPRAWGRVMIAAILPTRHVSRSPL